MRVRRLVWSGVVRAWEQVWGAQWSLCVLRERAACGWDDRAEIWGRRGERVVCGGSACVRVCGRVLAAAARHSLFRGEVCSPPASSQSSRLLPSHLIVPMRRR